MNTTETSTPEKDLASQPSPKKTGYNGLYRKNNRMPKKDNDNQVKEVTDTETLQDTETVQKVKSKKRVITLDKKDSKKVPANLEISEDKDIQEPKKKITLKKKTTEVVSDEVQKISNDKDLIEENVSTVSTTETTETEVKTTEIEKQKTSEFEPAIEEVTTVRSPFHELLHLIRQKNAYNHNEFFFELEKVLETIAFTDIKESNLSLFGFACMYDRDIIFQILCEKYAEFISQDDLESIMKICFTKREETVGYLIKVYSDHFTPSPEFIKSLFQSMSISSYRESNNIQILEWLAPYLTEDEYEVFWNEAIKHRNVSIMHTALHVQSIRDNLRANFSKYVDGFKILGKEHTMIAALDKEYRKIPVIPFTPISQSIIAPSPKEVSSVAETDNDSKAPTIIIKKKSSNS